MSEIQYGLISRVDSDCMEKTFDLIFQQFTDEVINYTEIGLYNGRTTSGVKEYFKSKGKQYNITGIDNFKDKEELAFYPEDAKLIQGSSIEVYNHLPDESQHFIMIDGNHSFPYVIADFFCYKSKVKIGGYICFHDASPQTQGKSWQRMGDISDPDMSISVMKALESIGMLKDAGYDLINGAVSERYKGGLGFRLAFHEWDVNDEGSGVIIFKRMN